MKKKYIAIILIILLITVIVVKVIHNSNPKITIFRPKNVNRLVIKNINKYVEESKNEFFKLLKGRRSIARPELFINYEKSTYKDVDFIYWNVDTLDWKIRTSKSVYDNIMRKSKDGSVILLHDMYPSTVEGVLRAIDEMKEDNFVFLTMDELRKMYKKTN